MKKKKRSVKNLKISTRITIATVFGVLIPITIIGVFSILFYGDFAAFLNLKTIDSNTYSVVNVFQWNQALNEISDELISDHSDETKLKIIEKLAKPAQKVGSLIYISNSSGEFYTNSDKKTVFDEAKKITKVNTEKNTYCVTSKGMVLLTHAASENEEYLIVIANPNYTLNDVIDEKTIDDFNSIVYGRTAAVAAVVAAVFFITALAFSFITSSTIIKPIKKLEEGSHEIANGNLDFVIEYDSTNEIGKTVNSFNEMTMRLRESLKTQEEAQNSRRDIITGLAHDLRTPLTSIKGYVEGLRDGIADTPEKQERYFERIFASTATMEKLLNDLLTVSKLEAGNISIDLQRIKVNDFLDDCQSYISLYLEKRGFEIEYNNKCSDNAYVMLDSDQFQRVIRNIVSNSIKYSKEDVQGVIKFSATEYESTVIIAIEDNGIGVSSENLPKIFDSFFRADSSRTQSDEGSGIGLYVCKQIVELHGGRIWATGKEGVGLTIHIALDKIKQNKPKGKNIYE
ncbi:MAG: HAMP domain-containing histidine kinase [Ruminococcaceae bacterium]|nr:HAMP domain-containing histidine kinase [Oscillospiraceae bacterium]